MNDGIEWVTQHLIDPELCVRCGSCEEACTSGAVQHDARNFGVEAERCNSCRDCVAACPTGAVDVWRPVPQHTRYPLAEQLLWDQLPAPVADAVQLDVPAACASALAPEFRHTREQPGLATVVSNTVLTAPDAGSEVHHLVLDLGADFEFREGQSLGILPPGVDAGGRPHAMRLYSIASARDGEQGRAGRLALTIKRVVSDAQGQPHRGVCSNHVCDSRPGDTLRVVGPCGLNFLLPDDPAATLIMICTGTGIAPMRGMLDRRAAADGATVVPDLLFYGARTPGELAYADELSALPAERLDLNLAFSRLPGRPRQYVQDLLRARSDVVAARLRDERCHLYLCGLRSMEAGVLDALQDFCAAHGLDWRELALAMKRTHRLHIETY